MLTSHVLLVSQMRAVYAACPQEFSNDGDGKKAAWRTSLLEKLKELVEKEKNDNLPKALSQNKAYDDAQAIYDPDAEIVELVSASAGDLSTEDPILKKMQERNKDHAEESNQPLKEHSGGGMPGGSLAALQGGKDQQSGRVVRGGGGGFLAELQGRGGGRSTRFLRGGGRTGGKNGTSGGMSIGELAKKTSDTQRRSSDQMALASSKSPTTVKELRKTKSAKSIKSGDAGAQTLMSELGSLLRARTASQAKEGDA